MRWLAIVLSTLSIVSLSTMTVQSENGENRIQWQVQKKLSAGEKPNRLIKEKSPYLLQHAFNPVDWYPWGEEAIARARKEDKPIFLSVGYSTCHWCHVMAEESFEDQAIADILNKWFISIKVDREERPDIDQMYMAATQLMSGSGGWPMSVFMMHDGSPFYTGTYFPVESMGSRPGFKIILLAIQKAWAERRDDLTAAAAQLIQTLELGNLPAKSVIEKGVIERAYSDLVKRYDKLEGGFSTAPKFPRPAVLSFLLSYYLHRGEEKSKEMVMHTIEKMAAGGMYDQLGGGFHRYSVDQKWKVPHFEKMLYDQAQLVNSYLAAFQITRDKQYAIIAEEILAYTLREMHDPGGGFYSAEDADSDDPYNPAKHSEGAYYLWMKDDVDQRLGNIQRFLALYMEYEKRAMLRRILLQNLVVRIFFLKR